MKNCLHTFTKWIFCLLAFVAINDLSAQSNVQGGFCDYAIEASCGVAITNQTTVGGPNVISDYPQCNSYVFSAPEKVYKFTTTSIGTIQIDLAIYTALLDLDIHLMADNCSVPTCLAQSITNNSNGQTEQIIYENAPAGDYYVIVDAEKDAGAFDLLISCNVAQGCNLDYTATAKHLGCGQSRGSIDLEVSMGKAPYKIEWDNASNTIWNTYTTSSKEYTITNLLPGSYTVKMTDAMGCVLMRNNIAINNSNTSLDATFSSTPAPCGSNFGWININVENVAPNFWVTVSGPRSGTVNATSNTIVVKDMPPGDYEVKVEKGGCSSIGWVTVGNTQDLDFEAEVTSASCGGMGSMWMTVAGGDPTYTIEYWHIDGTANWVQSATNSFSLDNLKPGEYTIKVTGRNGCSKTKKVTVDGGSLEYALESNAASCSGSGSVWVTIANGTAGYVVEWTGAAEGWKNSDSKSFAIEGLVAGDYEFSITDANGCVREDWITVGNSGGNLDFALEANNADCEEEGAIWVTINNGAPGYTVEWWGPNVAKWATTQLNSFQLSDLGAGEYTVKITDANGCSNTEIIIINDAGSGLDIALETLGVSCGAKGSIWIDVNNGTPNYSVDITGPNTDRWFELTSSRAQVTDLGAGTYTVVITDAKGCTGTKSITIEDIGGSLDIDLEANDAGCGNTGSMWVTVNNGSPGFTIELWGPNNATFWAQTNSTSFRISELNAGDYTLKITDANGCSVTTDKTVGGGNSNLGLALEVNNAGCEDNGRIWVTVNGGTAGYNIKWQGPTVGEANISTTGYQINDLKAGNYTITVRDYYGCTYSETVDVYGSTNNLELALESNRATCSQNGFLWADVRNGEGPYEVSWTGAAQGTMNVNNPGFQVSDLPAGGYTISVRDKNGCSVSQAITVFSTDSDINFSIEANNGACGENGYASVTINSGEGPYHISWTGPSTGEAASSNSGYQISDLVGGDYVVTIRDKNGCQSVQTIKIVGTAGLAANTETINANCGGGGQIIIDWTGGNAPFSLSLEGPMIGNTTTSDNNYHFPNIPVGNYTLTLQDYSGCVVVKQITIAGTGSTVTADVETNSAFCGQKGSAWLTMGGGIAPYTVSWTGPESNSAVTNTSGYQMTNLSAGTYDVVITDKNGCFVNKSITINNTGNSLNLSLEANNASCGQKGAIWVTTTDGTAPYDISWSGPSSSAVQTNDSGYQIADLNSGTYTVIVVDKNGCSVTETIIITDEGSSLSLSGQVTAASCSSLGSIYVTISGGSAGYSYSWTGPASGSTSTSASTYRIDNLLAGTYTVTARDSKGCSDTQIIIITDEASNLGLTAQASAASCSSLGSISAAISGGTAGFSYSWTGPVSGSISTSSATKIIADLPAGTYTVTARDSRGCSVTKTVIVTDEGSNLSLTTQATAAGCTSLGSIYATISGGTPGFSYSWTGPVSGSISTSAASQTIADLPAGSYIVTVRDSRGCSAVDTVSIMDEDTNIGLTTQATAAGCSGPGSILATISGGAAGFSYSWTGPVSGSVSTSSTSQTIADLPAGTYIVTVRDTRGCSAADTVSITDEGSNIGLTAQATAAGCSGPGSILATISGGTAGFSYSWTGPVSGSVSTSSTSQNIADLPAGTYTVTVRDSRGCSASQVVIVTDQDSNISLTTQITAVGCSSQGVIFAKITGGTAGFSYSWTGPVSGSFSTSSPNHTIDNLPAGSYTVTVRDSRGCSDTQTIIITDDGSTIGLTTQATAAGCTSPGSILATISGGTAGFSYSWTGPVSGSVSTSSTSQNIADLPAGIYTVTVRDTRGCSATQTVEVTSGASDVVLNTDVTDAVCSIGGSIWLTVSGGSPAYTYIWTGAVSGSITTNETGYNIQGLPAGNYVVTVRDGNGCEGTQTVTIKEIGSNIGLTLGVTNASCGGRGSILATITDGVAGYSFAWSGPVSGSFSTSDATYRIDDLPTGTYTVTVRDSKGCSTSKVITVGSNGGVLTVDLSSTTSVACEHDGTTLVSIGGGTAPYTINYTGPTTGSAQSATDSYLVNDLLPGDYTFNITDANGCTGTRKITVFDNGSDLAVSLTATDAACGSQGMIVVNIIGGISNYTISWTGGGITGSVTTGNRSFVLTDLPIGNYSIEVRDGIGCTITETASVNSLGGNLGLQLVPTNDVCGLGGSIEVRIDGGVADYQIDWEGPISGNATSSNNVYTINGLSIAGNYIVTVIDANGCEAKEWVAINTGGAVNFGLTGTNETCTRGGNILVSISSGAPDYTINWSGPESGSTVISSNGYRIENLVQGTYTVTVRDNKGCETVESIVIDGMGTDIALGLTNTNSTCGTANGSINATVSNGLAPYTFSWTGPVSGSQSVSDNNYTINDLPGGNYTITVRDANGCIVNRSISISEGANALALNVVGRDAVCGQPSSIQVTISNGVPNFNIEWTGPTNGTITTAANSYTISDVANGEYTVRITDASGCSKAQVVVINSNENDVSFTYESRDATCTTKGAIWLTISDGNGPYQINWTGPSEGSTVSADAGVQITDLEAGVYSVTVNDKDGCSITQSIEVKNTGTGGTVNFTNQPTGASCNNKGNILLTVTNGSAPYAVTWTGPISGNRTANTADILIDDLDIGTYTVTVTGAGGCGSKTQSITIDDNRVVLGVAGSVTNGVCGEKGSVQLSWAGVRGPYTISWTGTASGNLVTNANSETVSGLIDGTYVFTVTSIDGCSGQYEATINNGGTGNLVNFTFSNSAKTVNFTNLSPAGTYAWDFGDGNTSTETNPTHTYEKNGTYTVCLNVTNSCGTAQKCQTVSINAVTSSEPSAKVVLGDMEGPTGTVLQLPVRVENCTKLGTLSGTIMLGNNNVATIMGVSPNVISPVYNSGNYTFSYLASGLGMSITSETILFYINVQLTGGVGQSSSIDLSSLPVALELTCTENGFSSPITPEVGSGRVSITTSLMADVGGTVKTFWGEGVGDAMVNISSVEQEVNSMTSVRGEYNADEIPTGYEYTFTPTKTSSPANGLSTFGLFLTQKYILGYEPEQITSPYQVIAMDANCSGTLTTFDLFAMQQMLVGNISEFPGCNSWVFVSADHEFPAEFDNRNVFPYADSHTMMLESESATADFIGIKVGDVLGRAIPVENFGNNAIAEDRNRQVVPILMDQKTVDAGEVFEVNFRANDLSDMVSFQLGLDFDSRMLEFVEFIPTTKGDLTSTIVGVQDNQLKISWFDPAGAGISTDSEQMFTLKFVAKQKISDLLEQIQLNNRTFNSELHKSTNDAYRFKLETDSPVNSTFKVHQNTPNPFMDFTTITIEMPKEVDAEIILHDNFGRTVRTINHTLNAGINQLPIKREMLGAGVYYYTIIAGDFTDTKRMLIVE